MSPNQQSVGCGAVPSPDIRKFTKMGDSMQVIYGSTNQTSQMMETSGHLMRPPLQVMAEPHFEPKSLGQETNLYYYKKDNENDSSSNRN